ncbi:hypothetical protein WME90_24260 [Sorangium sp. So ce375]|uniref:hypothetical protein n=1 Tax=Sorangium sp. So ce375 TaxID=3133306 RepID=UPI003F5BED5D
MTIQINKTMPASEKDTENAPTRFRARGDRALLVLALCATLGGTSIVGGCTYVSIYPCDVDGSGCSEGSEAWTGKEGSDGREVRPCADCGIPDEIRDDLSIRKRHEGTFVAGGVGVFEIAVSNNSGAPAFGITVTDVLDPVFTFVSASPSPPWSCAAVAQTVTCTFAGTLPPFTSAAPIRLDVRVNDRPETPEAQNCASVSSDGNDATPKDNTSCDSLEIAVCPALELDLSSGGEAAWGLPGSVGDKDDSWTIVAAPDPSLIGSSTILSPNPAWLPAFPGSQWVGPEGGSADGLTGFYTYESCFTLEQGFTVPMLDLSIRADDVITAISLNGCMLPGAPGGSFNMAAPIHVQTSDPSCFQPGTNCIDITVENGPGPTSLDVAGTVTADHELCCKVGPIPGEKR